MELSGHSDQASVVVYVDVGVGLATAVVVGQSDKLVGDVRVVVTTVVWVEVEVVLEMCEGVSVIV